MKKAFKIGPKIILKKILQQNIEILYVMCSQYSNMNIQTQS